MLDEGAMRESLMERLVGSASVSKADAKKTVKALGAEIHKLETAISKLYEDWAGGVISEDTFTALIQKNESERQAKERQLSLLEQSEREAAAKESDIAHWMRLVREYAAADDLNREMLEALIEKVEVGEKSAVNGRKQQDIRVFYKFVGLC